MKHIRIVLVCFFFLSGITVSAQTAPARDTVHQANGWLQYFGTFRVSDRWSLHGEIQLRRSDVVRTWQQILPRLGVNYDVNKHVTLTVGYADVHAWPYGAQPIAAKQPERRFWEQVNVKAKLGKVDFENRFRMEHRLLKNLDAVNRTTADGYFYQNRVRHRAMFVIPLSRRARTTGKPEKGDVFLNLNNETFFNFGRTVGRNVFDQNRFAASVGYRLSSSSNVQVGYLHQYIQKADGIRFESNHTLTVAFSQTLDLRKLFGKG